MSQDEKRREVTITFGGFGLSDSSIAPVGAGQFKKLATLAVGAIPADIPKGFAGWLIDGGMRSAFTELFAAQLAHWRSQHFELKFVARNEVPENQGGTLASHFRKKEASRDRGNLLIYEGKLRARESVLEIECGNRKKQQSFYYHVTTIDNPLFKVLFKDPQNGSGGFRLTPIQVHDILWNNIVTYDGRDYLFFLGFCDGLFPLFMRAWHEKGYWRLREEMWGDPMKGAENVYLVFGKELPKQAL